MKKVGLPVTVHDRLIGIPTGKVGHTHLGDSISWDGPHSPSPLSSYLSPSKEHPAGGNLDDMPAAPETWEIVLRGGPPRLLHHVDAGLNYGKDSPPPLSRLRIPGRINPWE